MIGMSGSALGHELANSKGTIGTRIDHAASHAKNNIKTAAAVVSAGAGVTGTTALANTKTGTKMLHNISKGIAKGVKKAFKNISKIFSPEFKNATLKEGKGFLSKAGKTVKRGVKAFSKMSRPAKAVAAATSILATITVGKIALRNSYDNGKIDQKYEERAKYDDKFIKS